MADNMIDNSAPEWALAKYAHDLSFSDIDEKARHHISKMIFDVIIISIGAYNKNHQSGKINEDFNLEYNKSDTGSSLWLFIITFIPS